MVHASQLLQLPDGTLLIAAFSGAAENTAGERQKSAHPGGLHSCAPVGG
jgi:hypothetical protein